MVRASARAERERETETERDRERMPKIKLLNKKGIKICRKYEIFKPTCFLSLIFSVLCKRKRHRQTDRDKDLSLSLSVCLSVCPSVCLREGENLRTKRNTGILEKQKSYFAHVK